MKVPVTVIVDSDTKKYEIEIAFISSRTNHERSRNPKGSGASGTEWAGDVTMDAVVKVANTKLENSYASSLKSVAKTIVGTCLALGVKVEGKTPKEITAEINEGKWDEKFQ